MVNLVEIVSEADEYARRLHEIYDALRSAGYAYAWVNALAARDALDELVTQLRSDIAGEASRSGGS